MTGRAVALTNRVVRHAIGILPRPILAGNRRLHPRRRHRLLLQLTHLPLLPEHLNGLPLLLLALPTYLEALAEDVQAPQLHHLLDKRVVLWKDPDQRTDLPDRVGYRLAVERPIADAVLAAVEVAMQAPQSLSQQAQGLILCARPPAAAAPTLLVLVIRNAQRSGVLLGRLDAFHQLRYRAVELLPDRFHQFVADRLRPALYLRRIYQPGI